VGGFNPDGMGDSRWIWYRGDGETGLHKKVFDRGYKVVYTPTGWVYHRIPAARLTDKAFFRRGFREGLSTSYTDIRNTSSGLLFGPLIAGRAVLALSRALLVYAYAKSRGRVRQIQRVSRAWFWYGYGMQHLRVLLDHDLRSHVLRTSYLPE